MGGRAQTLDRGAKDIFEDEVTPVTHLENGGPTSQHFGPMSQKATHMGGIGGEQDASSHVNGAYVTFYEDGTAGFFGKTTLSVANPKLTRLAFGASTVVDTQNQSGRIRPF